MGGARGVKNITCIDQLLGLLRRPRRRTDNIGNRLYRCSLIYIFQKCLVCPNRISSFWFIKWRIFTKVLIKPPITDSLKAAKVWKYYRNMRLRVVHLLNFGFLAKGAKLTFFLPIFALFCMADFSYFPYWEQNVQKFLIKMLILDLWPKTKIEKMHNSLAHVSIIFSYLCGL